MTSPIPPFTGAVMFLADTGALPESPDSTVAMPWDLVPWPYLAAAVVLTVLVAVLTNLVRTHAPVARKPSRFSLARRATWRLHPGPGWASGWQRWRSLGLPRARGAARAARPSLSWWDRHKPGGWREYATHLGTAWGWLFRRRVVATSEDVVIVFGGPRRGKSQAAATTLIDAPGKVLATSVRGDVLDSTVGPRSQKGTVYIWNPERVGDTYGSSLRWNPVAGCEDPRVAARRAGYMVEANSPRGLSDGDFWSDQTSMVLAGYLHAAALVGYSMTEVYAWSNGQDNAPLRILREAQGAFPATRADLEHFQKHMPDRTQGSVVTTLRRVLGFMRSPEVSTMLSPHPDPQVEMGLPTWFEVEDFLTSDDRATLYLISSGDDGVTAPLFAALIAEIGYTVREVSARMPGGRLVLPLDIEGDEIANVAPIPVHRWASWMGGCGVRMRIYAQSWSQLKDRYQGLADSLWACAAKIVVYGGSTEEELLRRVTSMAGEVKVRGEDQVHWGTDREGKQVKKRTRTYEKIRVLPPHEMRLPPHYAVVLSTDVPPVLISTPQARKRADVKKWKGTVPDCVVAPAAREVAQVDRGLRARIDQPVVEARPLRAVATGTDSAAVENSAAPSSTPVNKSAPRADASAQTPTQPMPSMREQAPARDRSRPDPRPRGRGVPETGGQSAPSSKRGGGGGLHPTPWDLPRSEPAKPTTGDDDDLRGARLPWDEE